MKLIMLALLFAITFTGCSSNPYAAYYKSNHKPGSFAAPIGYAQVIQIEDAQFRDTVADLRARGLVCIGNSCFNSNHGYPSRVLLLAQADKLQADKVILVSKVIGVQTMKALPTWQPAQTYTTTTTGNLGPAFNYSQYSGTSYTTTPGQVGVQYVPCRIEISEIGASYWRRPIP